MNKEPIDSLGQTVQPGDWIAVARAVGNSAYMATGLVTKFNFRSGSRKVKDWQTADRYTIGCADFSNRGDHKNERYDSNLKAPGAVWGGMYVPRVDPETFTVLKPNNVVRLTVEDSFMLDGLGQWAYDWLTDFRWKLDRLV